MSKPTRSVPTQLCRIEKITFTERSELTALSLYGSPKHRRYFAILAICLSIPALASSAAEAPMMEREPDGIALHLAAGELRIQVISDAVVRVVFPFSPSFFSRV